MAAITTRDELLASIETTIATAGRRAMFGIVGPPGAGKTHLCRYVHEQLTASGHAAAIVTMDGYHLPNEQLDSMGRRNRKGAPDTFDADAFVDVLRRLRTGHLPVRVSDFARAVDEPIADARTIDTTATPVLVEGNYLLVAEPPWADVRGLLDAVWYLDVPAQVRRARLMRRQEQSHGSQSAAARWIHAVDEPNAAIVERTRDRADYLVAPLELPGGPLW